MTLQSPEHLLVPIDFSDASAAGLRVALELAGRFKAKITVLHVEAATANLADVMAAGGLMADFEVIGKTHRKALREQAERFVAKHAGRREGIEILVSDALFVSDAIVAHADELHADWICMGATGLRAIERLVLGSTAAEVVRRSRIPVLALRARKEDDTDFLFDDFRRVLVALDLGENSKKLVELGTTLAQPGGELTLLHVVEELTERGFYGVPLAVPAEDEKAVIEWTEIALSKFLEDIPDSIVQPVQVRVGRPGASILAVERELRPDVTIVGTHGRHGAARFTLGSVAERVVRNATGPVLVVPTGQDPEAGPDSAQLSATAGG